MTFEQAVHEYESIRARYAAGAMAAEEFHQAVGQLQVTDAVGRTWTLDSQQGGWLVWDGRAWQRAEPDAAAYGQSAQAGQAGMDTAWQEEKGKPLTQRSSGWWDLIAILGGLMSGYLWFSYSSLRTFIPRYGSGASWSHYIIPFFLFLFFVLGIVFRRYVLAGLTRCLNLSPLVKLLVAGGVSVGALIIILINNNMMRRGEGLNVFASLMMVLMPMGFVWFRKPIDMALRPLQSVRRHVPRLVLVIAGIGIPFILGFILYYGCGIRQYPLINYNVVIGTLLSYVILRTPRTWGGPGVGRLAQGAVRAGGRMMLLVFVGFVVYWLQQQGWADDFYSDPFNLNDGLRTDGVAPILSGGATAVVSVLINGVEVIRTVITDPNADPDDPVKQANYAVVVDTLNKDGTTDTSLDPTQSPTIFIYAHCEKGGAHFPQGDSALSFTQNDAHQFVTVTDIGSQNGRRCARMELVDPPPAGNPPKSVSITIGGGQAISAPVSIAIEAGGIEIEWNVEPAEYYQDGIVVMPGDGKSQFRLNCWAVKRNPETGQRELFEDCDFSHMLQPDSFPHQVFGIKEMPPTGKGHRQTTTDWLNKLALPNDEYNVHAPADAGVRIRAWQPAGEITRLGGGRIEVNEAQCKGEIEVPVRLEEVNVLVELAEPEMPIPADGEDYEVTLLVRKEEEGKPGTPQKDLTVSWERKESKVKWKGTPETTEGVTDSEGRITFTYTAPEVSYSPNGIYYEDYTLYRGSGEKRVEIGEFRLLLAPELDLRVSFKKGYKTEKHGAFGLLKEPEELTIEPKRKARAIRFCIEWESEYAGSSVPVFEAPLWIEWFDSESEEYKPLTSREQKPLTDKQGQYIWEPPELKDVFKGKGEEVEWSSKETDGTFMTPLAEKTIEHYEDKVEEYCPLDRLSADTRSKLTEYPKEFCRQMAQEPQRNLPRLRSAAELLRTASGYSKIYMDLHANIFSQVREQLVGVFCDIVMVFFSIYKVAERVLNWGVGALARMTPGFVKRFLVSCAAKVANKVRTFAHTLRGLANRASDQSDSYIARMFARMRQAISEYYADVDLRVLGEYGHQKLKNMSPQELKALGALEKVLAMMRALIHYVTAFAWSCAGVLLSVFASACRDCIPLLRKVVQQIWKTKQAGKSELLAKLLDKKIGDMVNKIGKALCEATDAAVTGPGGRMPTGFRGTLVSIFDLAGGVMESTLKWSYNRTVTLQVPVNFEAKIDAHRDTTSSLGNTGLDVTKNVITYDQYASNLDTVVFCLQIFIIILSAMFATIASAPIAAAIKGLDVPFGTLKAVVRLIVPSSMLATFLLLILMVYRLSTEELYKSAP